MEKQKTIAVFLGIILMLLSLFIVSSVAASSSRMSAYRLDAKGGIPGAPENKPKPPREVAVKYELFIEIDYMKGHKPKSAVLDYVHTYYLERGINVTFYTDDVVPLDPSVSDTDFWAIEAKYNDHDYGYYSKWKWVLYGTNVENEPNVVGYTYVILSVKYVPRTGRIISVDCSAGNYIFIADRAGDLWALNAGIEPYGAEAVVLMHELGHSVGIMNVGWSGNLYADFTLWEIYDPDPGSVMSYLSEANAGLYGAWYYSDGYWRLRNMEYYTI